MGEALEHIAQSHLVYDVRRFVGHALCLLIEMKLHKLEFVLVEVIKEKMPQFFRGAFLEDEVLAEIVEGRLLVVAAL